MIFTRCEGYVDDGLQRERSIYGFVNESQGDSPENKDFEEVLNNLPTMILQMSCGEAILRNEKADTNEYEITKPRRLNLFLPNDSVTNTPFEALAMLLACLDIYGLRGKSFPPSFYLW
jgi:hypothetical protein